MVSVLDLMTLCLDLANFGSAEANPADSSIYVLSIPWKSNFFFKGGCTYPTSPSPHPDPHSTLTLLPTLLPTGKFNEHPNFHSYLPSYR